MIILYYVLTRTTTSPMLSSTTHTNINTLKNLSTQLYWTIKTETDNNFNTRWNSLIHRFNSQQHTQFYWKCICYFYKMSRFISKSITTNPTPPLPPISKLQNEPVSKQNIASIEPPTVSIKKHKFTGSNPNTATANFLQFMKFEKGMSPDSSISHKLRTEWKEEKNFDPKIYHSKLKWFKWIELNMILS